MDVFEKQEQENPEAGLPNVHPIVTLVGEEYRAAEEGKRSMDPTKISISRSTDLCRERRSANPRLNKQLTLMTLYHLLKDQEDNFWWLPGIPDPSEEDESDREDDDDDGMQERPGALLYFSLHF